MATSVTYVNNDSNKPSENIQDTYNNKMKYVEASMELIKNASTVLNTDNTSNNLTDSVSKMLDFNNDGPILKKIEDLLPSIESNNTKFSFLFENETQNKEKVEILMNTVKKVLEALKRDWSMPSWIDYFKTWLFYSNNQEYLLLKNLGINRYKKTNQLLH